MSIGLNVGRPVRFGADDASSVAKKHRGTDTCGPDIIKPVSGELAPFMMAADNGADAVELDLRPYGKNTFKTRQQNGRTVYEFNGKAIPSLKEVLSVLPPEMKIFIELKSSKVFLPSKKSWLEKQLVEFIRENNLYDRVTVISFAPLILKKIEQLDPKIKTGLRWMFPRHQNTTVELLDKAHRQGTVVVPWVSGNHRQDEISRFDGYLEEGADATITNATDAMRARVSKRPVQFSGNIGRNDMQNLLMPNWAIRWYSKHREAEQLWQRKNARYEQLTQTLRDKGLDKQTIAEMHNFSELAMGFPSGLFLNMSDEVFQKYYNRRDDAMKERIRYCLDRYDVFVIDHYSAVFEAIPDRDQWKDVEWFLNGLLAHLENDHVLFTAQPLGIVTKKLAQMLETQSPYWQAFRQLIGYGRAIGAPQNQFACDVLYPLITWMPDQHGVNPVVENFVKNQLPRILTAFQENYPPPYDADLQKNIIQNVMMLATKTDRQFENPSWDLGFSDFDRPLIVQHTPLNHLARPPRSEENS